MHGERRHCDRLPCFLSRSAWENVFLYSTAFFFFFAVGLIGRSPFFFAVNHHPTIHPASHASGELLLHLCDLSRQLDGVGAPSPSTSIPDVANFQKGAPLRLTWVLPQLEVIPLTHTTTTQQRRQLHYGARTEHPALFCCTLSSRRRVHKGLTPLFFSLTRCHVLHSNKTLIGFPHSHGPVKRLISISFHPQV